MIKNDEKKVMDGTSENKACTRKEMIQIFWRAIFLGQLFGMQGGCMPHERREYDFNGLIEALKITLL